MSMSTGDDRPAMAALLDDWLFDVEALARLAGVDAAWVRWHVAEGLLAAAGGAATSWRFDAAALARARRIAVLERDFDAVPELAALVVDLEDEIRTLRAALLRTTV